MPIGDMLLKLAEGKPLSTGEKDELRRWASRTEMANAYVSGLDSASVSPNVDGLSARRLEVRDRMLIGSDRGTNPNLYYDSGAGELQFRQGTTVVNYIGSGSVVSAGVGLKKTAAQSVPDNTVTAITWDAEFYDDAGFHSTVTNTDRVTIPTDYGGTYSVGMFVQWDFDADGTRGIAVCKNGDFTAAGVLLADLYATPANGAFQMVTGEVPLVAGDYIGFAVNPVGVGSAINILASEGVYPTAWARKVR